MKPPRVRYAPGPTGDLAYSAFGEGPVDLLVARPYPLNQDLEWENPAFERFYRRLASFARVILPDQPPAGLTGGTHSLTLEGWLDDMLAVLEAEDSRSTTILGMDPAATTMTWMAGVYPDRFNGLFLMDPVARFMRAPDYPWGWSPGQLKRFAALLQGHWGTGELLRNASHGRIQDQDLIDWYGRLERGTFPPHMTSAIWDAEWVEVDLRGILDAITCPTMVVVHTEHPYISPEHGRAVANAMPNATLVERPGPYGAWWYDDVEETLDMIESFVVGSDPAPRAADRVLATVLFTDIVSSTERAAELGDARWREVLDIQGSVFERQLKRFNGRLVNTAGDGLLATFDGPARAIRCGAAIRDDMRSIGIEIRVGVHTGEIERRGTDIGGLAVHVGSRVMSTAEPGQILASSIVKDLIAGSGITFTDHGVHALKGVPDAWRLYAVGSIA